MVLKSLLIMLLSTFIFASNTCNKEFEAVHEAKEYIRILGHIEEYHLSCDVMYAYGLFLNDPFMMNELEEDTVFAEELGAFAKKYPYLSRLINDKETFEYFNKKYDTDKRNIDGAVKYAFKNNAKSDNYVKLKYLCFALDIVRDTFTDEGLKKTILHLKATYTPENLETIFPLWIIYREKYKSTTVSKKTFFKDFEQIIRSYSLPLLKKLQSYQDYIYPILLPEKYGDTKYIGTIRALMNAMKGKSLEQQLIILKNSYIDIQVALASGHSKDDIVAFYGNYLKRAFIQQFSGLTQYEKAGLVMLVGDHLDAKLDWMKLDSNIYRKITTTILKTKNIESLTNILGLYNYASALFERMPSKEQIKMLLELVNLPSKDDDVVKNLSLIYTLGENTEYFGAMINKNKNMEKKNKYIEMLYERQSGESIFSLFAKGNKRGLTENEEKEIKEAFKKQVNRLVATPYDEIHDLTTGEKVDIALEAADYASYAMIIVPGVGIAANIGKSLLTNGIKVTTQNVAKAGGQEAIGSYNSIKNGMKGMKTTYSSLKNSAKKVWENKNQFMKSEKNVLLPRNGGKWKKNVWKPDRDIVPKNLNVDKKTWGEILDEHNIKNGIKFKKGEPHFSPITKSAVKIKNFSTDRYKNFTQADEMLAKEWTKKGIDGRKWFPSDIKKYRQDNGLTWHERGNMKTLDLVPNIIHGNIPHTGGISAAKNLTN